VKKKIDARNNGEWNQKEKKTSEKKILTRKVEWEQKKKLFSRMKGKAPTNGKTNGADLGKIRSTGIIAAAPLSDEGQSQKWDHRRRNNLSTRTRTKESWEEKNLGKKT